MPWGLTLSINRFIIYTKKVKMVKSDKLENIVSLLKEQREFLEKKYKIKEIGVFGSYVRGEQDNDSDIDILIDKDESIGLLKLANLQNYLSKLIGIRVDLALKKSLRPHISKSILNEVIYV
jgi:predicted nucleotidyltransferase